MSRTTVPKSLTAVKDYGVFNFFNILILLNIQQT